MGQVILKVSLLLVGYSLLGVGLLMLLVAVKLLLDVFPEVLGAQILGILVVLLGYRVLGWYDKIFKR